MIQRIQTAYLLIVAIIIGLFYFFPFASFLLEQDMSSYSLSLEGLISNVGEHRTLFKITPLIFLLSAIILITLITIFLYKRRMLQIKLSILNVVLLVGLQGLLFYYTSVSSHQLGSKTNYSILFVLPVVSVILTYLAIRRIAKDEALVRSSDRLR